FPPDPVAAQIQRDPVDPGRELRLPAEVLDAAERAQERLLHDVARFLFPADDAIGQGIDGPFPAQYELVEALHVAAYRARDEFFVGPRHQVVAGLPGPVHGAGRKRFYSLDDGGGETAGTGNWGQTLLRRDGRLNSV